MSDLLRRRTVQNLAIATTGAAPVTPAPVTTGWPVGDTLLKSLVLRYSGVVSVTLGGGALSVVKQQIARLLSNITFGTDKHQAIIDQGMDGLSLLRMLAIDAKADPYYLDVAANAAGAVPFEMIYKIPIMDAKGARAWDTALDLLLSQPYLRQAVAAVNANTLGSIAGGAGTSIVITSLALEVSTEEYAGPFLDSNGAPAFASIAPGFQKFLGVQATQITATKSQFQIDLPYGDRIYRRIVIMPRDSVTGVERTDILGQTDQDRMSLVLNSVPIIENVETQLMQHEAVQEYAPATVAPGAVVIDFHKLMTDGSVRGARLSNDLALITPGQQVFKLLIDVTFQNGGSPALYIGYDCVKPLQSPAKRPEQLNPKVAAAVNSSKAGK